MDDDRPRGRGSAAVGILATAVFAAFSRTDASGDRTERRFGQIEVRLGRIEVALAISTAV